MSNQITTLRLYKHHGNWVFDDDRVGVFQEPFVGGMTEMIDAAAKAANIDTGPGLYVTFSHNRFPGFQYTLQKLPDELESGNNYHCPELNMKGWLCPVLLLYRDPAPQEMYIQIKEIVDDNSG